MALLPLLLIAPAAQSRTAYAAAPQSLAAPTDLTAALPGTATPLTPASWVSSGKVVLHFQVETQDQAVTPEVEMVPASGSFVGQPTFSGSAMTTSGAVTIVATGLQSGTRYLWQARIVDATGDSSPWTPFDATGGAPFDFGVDLTAPARPAIRSASDPSQNAWYNNRAIRFSWADSDSVSGIKGYTYQIQSRAHVIPPGPISPVTGVTLRNLPDGTSFLALRAVDRAGNWSPTATYRVQLDRQAPRLVWLAPAHLTLNPYQGGTTVRFAVTKASSVRLQLFRVGNKNPVRTFTYQHLAANSTVSLTWNGKAPNGRPVQRGYYFFYAQAVDHANNVMRLNVGGIAVNPEKAFRSPSGQLLYPNGGKEIIVSLSRQTLYAYEGTHLKVQTYVTTGNPSLPTPLGTYSVLAKYHPYEFISPWPLGSPYYYAPSLSNYALLFRTGGYFLHDAPWRSAFGPGTNGAGQPGTNYGGTHGCVNIPFNPTYFLYNWAPVGTPVLIVP